MNKETTSFFKKKKEASSEVEKLPSQITRKPYSSTSSAFSQHYKKSSSVKKVEKILKPKER